LWPDGTFFVTDGHEETRVVKFDKDGKFLMAWGERAAAGGHEMRPNYFNTVHASPLIISAGCTSTTAATGAFRSSMKTENSSIGGTSATDPLRRITST